MIKWNKITINRLNLWLGKSAVPIYHIQKLNSHLSDFTAIYFLSYFIGLLPILQIKRSNSQTKQMAQISAVQNSMVFFSLFLDRMFRIFQREISIVLSSWALISSCLVSFLDSWLQVNSVLYTLPTYIFIYRFQLTGNGDIHICCLLLLFTYLFMINQNKQYTSSFYQSILPFLPMRCEYFELKIGLQ